MCFPIGNGCPKISLPATPVGFIMTHFHVLNKSGIVFFQKIFRQKIVRAFRSGPGSPANRDKAFYLFRVLRRHIASRICTAAVSKQTFTQNASTSRTPAMSSVIMQLFHARLPHLVLPCPLKSGYRQRYFPENGWICAEKASSLLLKWLWRNSMGSPPPSSCAATDGATGFIQLQISETVSMCW